MGAWPISWRMGAVGADTWAMIISDLKLVWARKARVRTILTADAVELIATIPTPTLHIIYPPHFIQAISG